MPNQAGSKPKDDRSSGAADLAEWAGVLLGPIAWAVHQQTSYALVRWACLTGNRMILHVVSLAFLLLAITGGVISWRLYLQVREKSLAHSDESDAPRPQFMSVLGMTTSIMFSLIIVAQAIPSFILDPCQR